MNWKEFFKPDSRKIVLTLLVFFFLPIPIKVVEPGFCPQVIGGVCESDRIYWRIIFPVLKLIQVDIFINTVPALLLLSLIFILSYAISCLLVWVYDNKVKKK